MNVQTPTCFTEFQHFDDEQMHASTLRAARNDRLATARAVLHLAETLRRKLHLKKGYSTIYEYTRRLKQFTDSESYNRSAAAEVVAEFPEQYPLLLSGSISLSALVEARKAFRAARVELPQTNIKVSLANSADVNSPTAADTASDVATETATSKFSGHASRAAKQEVLNNIQMKSLPEIRRLLERAVPHRPPGEIRRQQGWNTVTAFLTDDELAAFKKIQSLLSQSLKTTDPNSVLVRLIELGLDKHDPGRKQQRVEARTHKPKEASNPKGRADGDKESSNNDTKLQSRMMKSPVRVNLHRTPSAGLRREVMIRDKVCQWRRSDGSLCGSSAFLDLDHIIPVAMGGPTTAENLRAMCASHNRNRMFIESTELITLQHPVSR